MPTINSLIKKRERLEAQIAQAQALEKRKTEIVALLEKHNLLSLTDAEILAALLPKTASVPASPATYANTPGGFA